MQKKFMLMLLFSAMVFWGLGWINTKVITNELGENEFIFLRYLFATLSMIVVLLATKSSLKISLKDCFIAFICSIFLTLYTEFYFLGLRYGEAGLGSAFSSTLIPIFTFMILVLFFKKPAFKKDIFALLLGLVGVFTIVGVWQMGIEQILTKYNIYFALASLLWAVLTLTSARAVDTKPLVFMFYMYTFTTIFGFGFSDLNTIHVDSFDFKFWANLLCLSILGTTFSTSMYFIGVEKLGSREASSFVFLVPFISMFFAWMFLGEHITIVEIGGTALTIFAVIILNSKEVPLIGKYLQKKF